MFPDPLPIPVTREMPVYSHATDFQGTTVFVSVCYLQALGSTPVSDAASPYFFSNVSKVDLSLLFTF